MNSTEKDIEIERLKFRSSNFSLEEQDLLRNLISKYKDTIMCKQTGKVSPHIRDKAWQRLHQDYNSQSGSFRTLSQLKNKWENMKRSARKNYATHSRELRQTGGGPAPPELDETTKFMIAVSKEGIQGLPSQYDSDRCEAISCESPIATTSSSLQVIVDDLPVLILDNDVRANIENEVPGVNSLKSTQDVIIPESPKPLQATPKTNLKMGYGKLTKEREKDRVSKRKLSVLDSAPQSTRSKFVELAELKLDIYKNKLYSDSTHQKLKEKLEIEILQQKLENIKKEGVNLDMKLENAKKENIKIDLEISLLKKKENQ